MVHLRGYWKRRGPSSDRWCRGVSPPALMLVPSPPRSRGGHLERVRVLERRRRHQGADLHVCRPDNRSSHGRCLSEVPHAPGHRLPSQGKWPVRPRTCPKRPQNAPKSVSPAESPEGRRSVAHLFGPTTGTRANPLGATGPSARALRAQVAASRRRWGVCTQI